MVKVVRHERGPRLYVLGRRCHHFFIGLVGFLIACAARRPFVAAAFAGYALTDWKDFPWTDDCNH